MTRETAHPPRGSWLLARTWLDTGFLHWPVDPAAPRPARPPGVTPETWRDAARVTVRPLAMGASRPRWVPPLLAPSDLPELDLRTDVRVDERPGIWFVSPSVAFAARYRADGPPAPAHLADRQDMVLRPPHRAGRR